MLPTAALCTTEPTQVALLGLRLRFVPFLCRVFYGLTPYVQVGCFASVSIIYPASLTALGCLSAYYNATNILSCHLWKCTGREVLLCASQKLPDCQGWIRFFSMVISSTIICSRIFFTRNNLSESPTSYIECAAPQKRTRTNCRPKVKGFVGIFVMRLVVRLIYPELAKLVVLAFRRYERKLFGV